MVTLPTFHCPWSPPPYTSNPTYYINPHPLLSLHLSFRRLPSSPLTPLRTPVHMDMYGQDFSGVDELLDFSNHDVLCSSTTDNNNNNINILHQHHNITSSNTTTSNYHFQYGVNHNNNSNYNNNNNNIATDSTDFTDCLSVPSNDVAELEWLSNFVHDSFSNFPANNMIGTINYRPENNDNNNTSFHSRSRSKRSTRTVPTSNTSWTTSLPTSSPSLSTSSCSDAKPEAEVVRRCTHCASEKTPQWRTGPLGPKTLCNACGVRYKSGRLVPEYRPAASPTFVLTQHSNSHRKVMELRRQKEVVVVGQQQQSSEYEMYGGAHHHHRNRNNYEVC